MMRHLTSKAANTLRLASQALARASAAAVEAQPSSIKKQDDDLAEAVFAEIEAAKALIARSFETPI